MPPSSTPPRSSAPACARSPRASREIDRVNDVRSLSAALGSSLRADADPLNATNFYTPNIFGVFVSQALQDPSRNVAYLLQGGLGMPDREYYLGASAMKAHRAAYRDYLVGVATPLGWPDAAARADRVIALETQIARAHLSAETAQDAKAAQEWPRARFAKDAPGIDWNAFFDAAQLGGQQSVIAWHPGPTRALSALGREPAGRRMEGLAQIPSRRRVTARCCPSASTI